VDSENCLSPDCKDGVCNNNNSSAMNIMYFI